MTDGDRRRPPWLRIVAVPGRTGRLLPEIQMPRFAALTCSLALSSALAAQSTRDPGSVLPASSWAVARFGGLAACQKAGEQAGSIRLSRMLLDRGLQKWIEGRLGRQAVDPVLMLRDQIEALGLDRNNLREVLQGPMALGVGRPVYFGKAALPSLVLAIDVGGREAAAEKFVADVARELAQRVRGVTGQERQIAGRKALVLSHERASGSISFVRNDGLLLVSNSPMYLAECLATGTGQDRAFWQRGGADVAAKPLLAVHLNVQPFVGWLGGLVPYEFDALGAAVGISAVQGLSLTLDVNGPCGQDVLRLACAGNQQGLLPAAFAGDTRAAVGWMPDDVAGVLAFRCDSQAIQQAIPRVLEALPQEARRELEREWQRETGREMQRAGIDGAAIRGLALNLGPELAFAATAPGGKSPLPRVFVAARVRDGAAVTQAIKELTAAAHLEWSPLEFQGKTIHHTKIAAGDAMRIAPAFAVVDGWLVAASDVLGVKSMLTRGSKPEGDLARSTPRGAAVMTMRLPVLAQVYADLVLGLAEQQLAQHPELGLEAQVLPGKDELMPLLGDVKLALQVDADGVTLAGEHPLSLAEIVAGLGIVLEEAVLGGKPKGKVY